MEVVDNFTAVNRKLAEQIEILNDAFSQKDETINELTKKVAELEKQIKQLSDTSRRNENSSSGPFTDYLK